MKDMKANYLFLLSLVLLIGSCATFKEKLVKQGGTNQAIQNAILDFSNTSSLYKKDSVFSVLAYEPLYRMILEQTKDGNGSWKKGKPYKGILAVSISASYNKILLTDKAKIGSKGVKMPTRYIINNGKLFYWWDDNYPLTQEALMVFKKYNLLVKNDLDGVAEFYDFELNDAQKGAHYYFCNNNLSNYKKIISNRGIGFYDAPNLKCGLK